MNYDRIAKLTGTIARLNDFLSERSGEQKIAFDPSSAGFTITMDEYLWKPMITGLRDQVVEIYQAELSRGT